MTTRKTSKDQAKAIERGLGLLDAFLSGMAKTKKKKPRGGNFSGIPQIKAPQPCGRCD